MRLVWAGAAAAAAVAGACAWSGERVVPGTTPDGANVTVEVRRTPSYALARITRREWVPDGWMQRIGTGRGATIYVFDGGIDATHPELAGRVRKGFDAFAATGAICNGHGLAVAGGAAGRTLGVASEATVVDVKIIDCATMRGTPEAVVSAAQWVIDDHRRRPREFAVANWSLSIDTIRAMPDVEAAIEAMGRAGILVVVSASNRDIDACRVIPANSPHVVSVGASTIVQHEDGSWRDERLVGTAYGNCVDLYAPGDTVPLPGFSSGQPVAIAWRGTSMAAAYVSGAAAVLMASRRSAGGIAELLIRTSTPATVDERRYSPAPTHRLLYVGPPD